MLILLLLGAILGLVITYFETKRQQKAYAWACLRGVRARARINIARSANAPTEKTGA